MLTLGFFVFLTKKTPFNDMQKTISWRHPTNSRVGTRPAKQFLGVDEEQININGVLIPEITGSMEQMNILENMANTGEAWPLIDQSGFVLGHFVIEQIQTTSREYLAFGAPAKIEFSITLKRVDD